MKFLSPAKVNLYLKILAKRPDGFHEIETLMVPVSLTDTIDLEKVDGLGIALTCDNPQVPTGGENLIVKAAEVFFERTGWSSGLKIHLEKRIPMGAGLGGGSSNAAAVLVALNSLSAASLPTSTLEELAGMVGSDVAWFIRGQSAICRGRGELIGPAVDVPKWPLLLLKPPFGVPTPWAYQAQASRHNPKAATQTVGDITLGNDLESAVFEKYLLLPTIKHWLLQQNGVRAAAMSGSGSTMFAILDSASLAEPLACEARAVFGETLWTHACEIVQPSSHADLPEVPDSGFFS